MSIEDNINKLRQEIPPEVHIIAVSKTRSSTEIFEAYRAGQRDFGENKAQEISKKRLQLPADVRWHFIGHLQTNKVKYIASYIHLIHSVDRLSLLSEINREGNKTNRVIDCLLQFHIASEETKFGLDLQEARDLLNTSVFREMKNIRICGVMGMASFTENESIIRSEFAQLSSHFHLLKEEYFLTDRAFRELSMGMSGDYPVAIMEGSTMVRIGTAIFGERLPVVM